MPAAAAHPCERFGVRHNDDLRDLPALTSSICICRCSPSDNQADPGGDRGRRARGVSAIRLRRGSCNAAWDHLRSWVDGGNPPPTDTSGRFPKCIDRSRRVAMQAKLYASRDVHVREGHHQRRIHAPGGCGATDRRRQSELDRIALRCSQAPIERDRPGSLTGSGELSIGPVDTPIANHVN
jgi:hypothetical protein